MTLQPYRLVYAQRAVSLLLEVVDQSRPIWGGASRRWVPLGHRFRARFAG